MGESVLRLRLHITCLAILLLLAGTGSVAEAAPRNVLFVWRYPPDAGYSGVALYHAPSEAELLAGQNVTRVDLGLPPATSDDVASVWVSGFDDTLDYNVALTVYDAAGNESSYSRTGLIRARAAADSTIESEDFESYRAGQDPDGWLDSASGSTQPGSAALFETRELPDGTIAFGTTSAAADLHSHFVDTESRHWASYEYTGRMLSDELTGESGVTFLSGYPDLRFYYRLARSGAGPFTLTTRGGGELRCAGQTSTGVAAQAGVWSRFQVRVTRFEGRNRVRANVWSDGAAPPTGWQIDCWDRNPQSVEAGRIGVYSSNGAGNSWDDLRVSSVANDGAPPAWVPEAPPPTPPPTGGYTSASRLVHWWHPGRDASAPGRDFSTVGAPIDGWHFQRNLSSRDFTASGTVGAFVALNGRSESFGNLTPQSQGIGDAWSLGVWLRPDVIPRRRARYVVDLNDTHSNRSSNRISLTIGVDGRFAIEVTDALGRSRAVSSAASISSSQLGRRWYHVVAVKSGTSSLALYVDGVLTASTDVAVPTQTNSSRVIRVGTRVSGGSGHFYKGAVHSIALWNAALRSAEVSDLYRGGDWSRDLSRP